MKDLITVIVPVYKVEKYLDQCITSIVEQTYRNLEIILIDDGSPDSSGTECDTWAMRDDRIFVIHKENGGLSSARNAGLDIYSGAYITYVDSDDWLDSEYVSILYQHLKENDADISSVNLTEYDDKTEETRIVFKSGFIADSEAALMKLYNQNELPVCACCKMYSSYIWQNLRFPIGHNYEDAYTTYLAIDAAEKIVHRPDAPYYYRVRSDSIMHSKFTLYSIERANAWNENYLFCLEKYPDVAPYARSFWLEHIPPLLSQFPSELTAEEACAKKTLKSEIHGNLGFILRRMPLKKKYHQLKALLFY